MTGLIIKGGTVVTAGKTNKSDILIEDGRIVEIAPGLECKDARVIEASGCLVCQSFADLHVHLREPGYGEKENVATGSAAAARGGYTIVCAMPNLNPVPDSPRTLALEQEIIDRDAVVEVIPYCSITKGRRGEELVDMAALKERCVAFSDDGSGVQDESMMLAAMKEASAQGVIIAAHCEDNSLLDGGYIHKGRYCEEHGHRGICSKSEWGQIERDLQLCVQTGCHYHVCHISTAESVDIIRRAKARGVNVTCETGPHYLSLCDDDLQEEGRFKMNPPLRAASDREALIQGLADGTIDVIATDHAPHTEGQKAQGLQGSAMGIVGLETSFPVVYTDLVRTGRVSLGKVVEAMSERPRTIFGLGEAGLAAGRRADLTVVDLEHPFRIDSSEFVSKGKSTPFEGKEVYGRVKFTVKDGKIIYQDGKETV